MRYTAADPLRSTFRILIYAERCLRRRGRNSVARFSQGYSSTCSTRRNRGCMRSLLFAGWVCFGLGLLAATLVHLALNAIF